jgi:hypothetical protein
MMTTACFRTDPVSLVDNCFAPLTQSRIALPHIVYHL